MIEKVCCKSKVKKHSTTCAWTLIFSQKQFAHKQILDFNSFFFLQGEITHVLNTAATSVPPVSNRRAVVFWPWMFALKSCIWINQPHIQNLNFLWTKIPKYKEEKVRQMGPVLFYNLFDFDQSAAFFWFFLLLKSFLTHRMETYTQSIASQLPFHLLHQCHHPLFFSFPSFIVFFSSFLPLSSPLGGSSCNRQVISPLLQDSTLVFPCTIYTS